MFRNMLKRSWLSVRRKLGRTIVLVLIFFIMANLVLAAITIKTAVVAQMSYAKAALGGTVTIQADMDKVRENQKTEMEKGGDRKDIFGQMVRPSVSVETADKIAEYSDYVKDYSYELSAEANSYDMSIVESKMPSFGNGRVPGGFSMRGAEESDDDEAVLDGDITISGINAYAYIDGVKNEAMEIKDGTYFDEDSENGVMVSYEFAELNELKVGDTFELKNIYTEKKIKLNVVGIYDTSAGRADANTLYMNVETAAQFLSDDDYNDGKYDVDDVNFYMNDSSKAEEFVEKINSDFTELAENNLKVSVDTTEYDAMASSIEGVGSFATTILIIVIAAAIVIVALIVTLNVRERRYEMGVLMSLGATKKNILGQIAAELIIVGTVGFALASITGGFLAKTMGQSILDSQIASSAAQSEKNFGRPGAQIGGKSGGQMSGGGQMPSTPEGMEMPEEERSEKKSKKPTTQQTNVELDISATPIDYLLLFVTGYVVIVLALIVPATNVLRYQPKEILAGKE